LDELANIVHLDISSIPNVSNVLVILKEQPKIFATRCQFHQHFMREFFIQKPIEQILCLEFGFEQTFGQKMLCKMLMKLNTK